MMKIVPVARISSLCVTRMIIRLSAKVKEIISDNKLMNLCEIGLFAIV